ncbi:MAG: hypothetical protein K6B14_07285 [Lachnospiraceae bacterium]|nr:hypothetical protein [Lachnospiraceae bacterium]
MNKNSLSTELEIDLIQVIKDLLLQWKAIIVAMLICGLAFPSLMYLRNMNNYEAAVAANEELKAKVEEANKIADKVGKNRSTDVFADVEDEDRLAVQNVMYQKRSLDSLKEYMKESPLMKLDPLDIDTLVLKYYLNTPDGSDLAAIGSTYVSAFSDTEFLKSVSKRFGTKSRYVSELLTVWGSSGNFSTSLSTGDILTIRIYLPKGVDAVQTEADIKNYVTKINGQISEKIGEHSMELIFSEKKTDLNLDIRSTQWAKESELVSVETNYNAAVNALTDEQRRIFEATTSTDIKDDKDIIQDEAKEGTEKEVLEPEKPGFSKKYAVVGLMGGLVLYCGIYFLLLILVPVIRTGMELSDILGIKSFGCCHSDPRRFGFFCDKFVYNLLYHKQKSADELMEDAAERIAVYAKYHEISEVTLVSADADSKAQNEALLGKLSSKGITAVHIDLWDGEKLTDLAEESMSGNDNYIISMMPRATLIRDVDKILSVASEYQKKIIGTVAI